MVIRPRWIRPMQRMAGFAAAFDAAGAGPAGQVAAAPMWGLPNRTGNLFLKNFVMDIPDLSALTFCSTVGSSFTFLPPFTPGQPQIRSASQRRRYALSPKVRTIASLSLPQMQGKSHQLQCVPAFG